MKRKQLFGTLLLLATLLVLPARGEVKSFTITFGTGNIVSNAWEIDNMLSGLKVSATDVDCNNTTGFIVPKDVTVKVSGFSSLHICKVVAIYKTNGEDADLYLVGSRASTFSQGACVYSLQKVDYSVKLSQVLLKPHASSIILDKVTVYYIENYDSNGYLSYDREPVTAGNYGTICLPGTVAAGNHTPATIYRITEKKSDGSAIVLEEVTGDMEAGIPYIFRTELPYFDCYQTESSTVANPGSDNGLIGSFEGTEVDEGKYLLSNNKVSLCGTGCSIGPNRAYISLDDVKSLPATAGAKRVTIGMDGGTGIEALARVDNAVWYDLLGNRVQQPSKGLYICNGKKVFVK